MVKYPSGVTETSFSISFLSSRFNQRMEVLVGGRLKPSITRPARMAPWFPGLLTALVGVTLPPLLALPPLLRPPLLLPPLPVAADCGVPPVGNCGGGMLSRGSEGWFLVIFLTSEQPLSATQRATRRAHDLARTTNRLAASLNTESPRE